MRTKFVRRFRILFIVNIFFLLSIFPFTVIAAAVSDPEGSDTAIVIGRVIVQWDGFQGVHRTDTSGFQIFVEREMKGVTEKTTYLGSPDKNGYFFVENVPLTGSYKIKEIKILDGTIPKKPIYPMMTEINRIFNLGEIKFSVNGEGKIAEDMTYGMQNITVSYDNKATAKSKDIADEYFIEHYFLSEYNLGGWAPLIKGSIDIAIKRKEDKKIEDEKKKGELEKKREERRLELEKKRMEREKIKERWKMELEKKRIEREKMREEKRQQQDKNEEEMKPAQEKDQTAD